MALVKDEWVIRSTSTITIPSASTYIRSQLDTKQEQSTNKDISGNYIDNFFADLFDSRDGSLYRVYSTGATNNTNVIAGDASNGKDGYYNVVVMSDIIENINNFSNYLVDADLDNYRVENEIIQIVEDKINNIQIDEVIIG